MEYCIHEIQQEHFVESAKVIRQSFQTVAEDFGFTVENNPSNGAFITPDKLREDHLREIKMFGLYKDQQQIGFVAIEKKDNQLYYLEKLSVVPQYRHMGYGKHLMNHVKDYVKKAGGAQISIGIINENTKLKKWYERYGFTQTTLKQFDHLTFTVCFMSLTV